MKKDLFIPLLILAAAALGCSTIRDLAAKKDAAGANSSTASNTSASRGATTASSDPKADIIAASKKFIELPSFSAKTEGTGGSELKMQIDYAAPDRYHLKYLAGTGAGMETIMIGKQTYMKTGGTWRKMPVDLGSSVPTLRDSFTEEGLKTLTNVKFDGDDTVDGKSALVYSYSNTTPQGNYPFTSKIWIGKDSGVPMKIQVDYASGTLKTMNVVYDTETPVTIEPPVN
ncbi:MAG TPA: hypothetical protein VK468_00930 [Pyrinomonadaceae bacterium]|nr:hypothetical protein [Pyrinomonadaceae bacterium]